MQCAGTGSWAWVYIRNILLVTHLHINAHFSQGTQNTFQNVFPRFLQPAADTDWGPLAQNPTFCQEQEQDLVNVASSTPVQPPGTLFDPTFMILLIPVHFENDSRMYFLIVLLTDSAGAPGRVV